MVGIGRWEVGLRIQHSLGGVKVGVLLRGFGRLRFGYLGLGRSVNCPRPSLKGVLACWILVPISR